MGSIPYAQQFKLPGKKSSLSQFARYLALAESPEGRVMTAGQPIMYVFDNELLTSPAGASLMEDTRIPDLVAAYSWGSAQFMWGPTGSGAPLHYHQDAWNALVFGEKRWWFLPPANASSSTRIVNRWDTSYHCTQRPGDFVYVPDSWSHAVFNTKTSAAIAIEFDFS